MRSRGRGQGVSRWGPTQRSLFPSLCSSQKNESVPHSSRLYRDEWAAKTWIVRQDEGGPGPAFLGTGEGYDLLYLLATFALINSSR